MDINEVSKSIGYCGLVCKLCHLADKCDGCKSNKNCCGKHLSEKGCYQYNCLFKFKFFDNIYELIQCHLHKTYSLYLL